jgi:nucleoid-associated protein YejK
LLDINDDSIGFISKLQETFSKRTFKQYGQFDNPTSSGKFSEILTKYLNNEKDFYALSVDAVKHLASHIEDSRGIRTGSYFVMAHYIDKYEFVAVALISGIDDFSLNELNLELIKTMVLNTRQLDMACFVNIELFQDDKCDYLSFIKGKKDVTKYFVDFIGSIKQKAEKESTELLIKLVDCYLEEKNISTKDKEGIRNELFSYCQNMNKSASVVKLNIISGLVDKENPDAFIEFANNQNNRLSHEFAVDGTILKRFNRIYVRKKGISLTLPKSEFKSKLVVNDNSITIKGLPLDFINELNKQI